MLMNSKTIHSEMIHHAGFDDESNKENRPGCTCDSDDCFIRVLYLYLFCTSTTAIWNRKYILSCFISGNNYR